jgi:pimeloyl-ACP methyl ester carboxylesterase
MAPIILVHDIWHTEMHWRPVRTHLTDLGYRVEAPTLPCHGPSGNYHGDLDTDIAAVEKLITAHQLQVVVVGHGWGAAIAAAAVARVPEGVRQFISVSGVLPAGPRSLLDELSTAHRDLFNSCLDPVGHIAPPPPEVWHEWYGPSIPLVHAARWHRTLTPGAASVVSTKVDLTDFYRLTNTDKLGTAYIQQWDDQAYGAGERWPRYARHLGFPQHWSIPGCHETLLAAPTRLARMIVNAIKCHPHGGNGRVDGWTNPPPTASYARMLRGQG